MLQMDPAEALEVYTYALFENKVRRVVTARLLRCADFLSSLFGAKKLCFRTNLAWQKFYESRDRFHCARCHSREI